MTFTLAFAWLLLADFIHAQRIAISRFKGSSQGYLLALNISPLLGGIVGMALLGYAFVKLEWYWPFALLALGLIVAGALSEAIERIAPQFLLAMLAFIGWPMSAYWAFTLLDSAA